MREYVLVNGEDRRRGRQGLIEMKMNGLPNRRIFGHKHEVNAVSTKNKNKNKNMN